MDKWEYKLVRGSLEEYDLNKYGASGYELVSHFALIDEKHQYIFKRKIK